MSKCTNYFTRSTEYEISYKCYMYPMLKQNVVLHKTKKLLTFIYQWLLFNRFMSSSTFKSPTLCHITFILTNISTPLICFENLLFRPLLWPKGLVCKIHFNRAVKKINTVKGGQATGYSVQWFRVRYLF